MTLLIGHHLVRSPRPDQIRHESNRDQVPPQPSRPGHSCGYSCFCGDWYPDHAHSIACGVDSRITVLEPDVVHPPRCTQGWLRPESACQGRRIAEVQQHPGAPNRPDACAPPLTHRGIDDTSVAWSVKSINASYPCNSMTCRPSNSGVPSFSHRVPPHNDYYFALAFF